MATLRRSVIIAVVIVDVFAGMSIRARGMPVRLSGIVVADDDTLGMMSGYTICCVSGLRLPS
ncbi:hypothetical protein D3C59_36410 [Streptomyces sp. SHP22-7]|nr:hypothetical protein D3C59_37060 [Streptomyces sp. SHP22-7]RIH58241.1 hypothetical protein D3C59_36410 [Streptomyces sp. SHP22-7]